MRAGGGMQRDAWQSGNLRQHLLKFEQQLQQSLQRLVRLIRMRVKKSGQTGQPLIPPSIVFHRARAERIKMRVDRHVEGRQIGEVPHHIGFTEFRQRRRRRRPQRRGYAVLERCLGNVARRQPSGPSARPRHFEQQSGGV